MLLFSDTGLSQFRKAGRIGIFVDELAIRSFSVLLLFSRILSSELLDTSSFSYKSQFSYYPPRAALFFCTFFLFYFLLTSTSFLWHYSQLCVINLSLSLYRIQTIEKYLRSATHRLNRWLFSPLLPLPLAGLQPFGTHPLLLLLLLLTLPSSFPFPSSPLLLPYPNPNPL